MNYEFPRFRSFPDAVQLGRSAVPDLESVFNNALRMRLAMDQAKQQKQAFEQQAQEFQFKQQEMEATRAQMAAQNGIDLYDPMVRKKLSYAQSNPLGAVPEQVDTSSMWSGGMGASPRMVQAQPPEGYSDVYSYLQRMKASQGAKQEAAGLENLKTQSEIVKNLATPGKGNYNAVQTKAIMSRDPEQLITAFPDGVPNDAIRNSFAGERIANTEGERQNRDLERTQARYRNYLLDIEQRDPIIKSMRQQEIGMSQMSGLLDLVNQGNSVAAAGMGTKMAKAMGEVGMLTESDIKRYITSGRLDQKAADTLRKWIQGVPSKASLKEIGQIAESLRSNFESKIQPRYDQYIRNYAAIEKIAPENLASEMGVTYGGNSGAGGASGPQPGTVKGGYKFRGGNPADKNNWEKLP